MRRVSVEITFKGTDITEDIKIDLISVSYTEPAEGESDSLTVNLNNTSFKWMNAWLPQSGNSIEAVITSYDWNSSGEVLALETGEMQIDEPSFSGPPDTISLKALSIPAAGFNDTADNQTWETITLRELGAEIARKYGMSFIYDAEKNFTISSLSRSNQTDSDFLKSTAEKYNLCTKVFSNKLILYSKHLYEQRPPVTTLIRGESNISSYTLEAPTVGTGYHASTVSYQPTSSSTALSYEFRIASGGKVLKTNESVDDLAQAELAAKAKLREANEKQYSGSFTMALNLKIAAACTVLLSGFGVFDGKYFVDTVTHTFGSGAGQTSIEVHKCLEGDY